MLVYVTQLIIVHKLLPQLMILPSEKRKVFGFGFCFFFNSHTHFFFLKQMS